MAADIDTVDISQPELVQAIIDEGKLSLPDLLQRAVTEGNILAVDMLLYSIKPDSKVIQNAAYNEYKVITGMLLQTGIDPRMMIGPALEIKESKSWTLSAPFDITILPDKRDRTIRLHVGTFGQFNVYRGLPKFKPDIDIDYLYEILKVNIPDNKTLLTKAINANIPELVNKICTSTNIYTIDVLLNAITNNNFDLVKKAMSNISECSDILFINIISNGTAGMLDFCIRNGLKVTDCSEHLLKIVESRSDFAMMNILRKYGYNPILTINNYWTS